jgi:hypothetical protein
VVEHLPSKCKALRNPSTTKKNSDFPQTVTISKIQPKICEKKILYIPRRGLEIDLESIQMMDLQTRFSKQLV